MKKALVLGALATLGALSFGCAMSDYGGGADWQANADGSFSTRIALNKSQGIISCRGNDRFANAQQTIESSARGLYQTVQSPTPGPDGTTTTICPDGFNPAVASVAGVPTHVDQQQAKDWERFNAAYAFQIEIGIFAPPGGSLAPYNGTIIMSGMKNLDNGAVRLNGFESHQNFTGFSCVGSQVEGLYGGPEGIIWGDGLTNPGATAPRIPGLEIDTVCIDKNPNPAFCGNVKAVNKTHLPVAQGGSAQQMSTYVGLLGRAGEGRIHFTPVTRHDGMAEFLNGSNITFTVQGITVTAAGHLNADGTINVAVQKLEANGAIYQAGDTPVSITVNPANKFRTMVVHAEAKSELVGLAQFALDAGLTDRQISLENVQVPELGLSLPPYSIMLNGTAFTTFINKQAGHGDN